MRIAMLCSGHPVNDARVTYKEAVSLARAGHEVFVFGRQPANLEQIPLLNLYPLISEKGGLLTRLRMLPKLYRSTASCRPDVIVCHEPESALTGLFLKLRYGMMMIFDVHECFQETLSWRMPRLLRPIVRAMTIALLRILVSRADWVTVVSQPNQRFLAAMRHDGRVEILHNSPPLEFFPVCNHDLDGPVTVVHEGYLYRQRGLSQMLEAIAIARRTKDIRFLIVGRVQPNDRNFFDQLIAQLDLSEAVVIPGWKPWEEIGKIESQAQIGLICHQYTPNSFLSLNNKLYNYMACGQAIIGPDGSATGDMIRKYDCGLCIDVSKADIIAEAILNLAEDVELRRRLGTNGRKAIEQELGWHKMEERLRGIYEHLARELKSQ